MPVTVTGHRALPSNINALIRFHDSPVRGCCEDRATLSVLCSRFNDCSEYGRSVLFGSPIPVTGRGVPSNINGLYPFLLTCLSEAFARTGILPALFLFHSHSCSRQRRPVLFGTPLPLTESRRPIRRRRFHVKHDSPVRPLLGGQGYPSTRAVWPAQVNDCRGVPAVWNAPACR